MKNSSTHIIDESNHLFLVIHLLVAANMFQRYSDDILDTRGWN